MNSTKVDDVLSGAAKASCASSQQPGGSYWARSPPYVHRLGNPPSSRALSFLTPLTLFCLLAGMLKTVIASAASARVGSPLGGI